MSLFAERYIQIKMLLTKIGLWPMDHVQIPTVVLLTLQLIFCLCAIVKSITELDKRTAPEAVSHCNGALLIIAYCYILIKEKESFTKLMCEIYGDALRDMNVIEQKCMQHAGQQLHRILKVGLFIYVCAASVKFVQPFVLFIYNTLFTSKGGAIVLPPPMALPIVYNNIITYVLESAATTILLSSVIGIMALFMVLVLYLCGQFKAVRDMLTEDCDLNRCIHRHIKLIELSKMMEKIYGPILWLDCVLSTINICVVLLSLASQLTVEHFFTEFSFLCAGILQLFVANWYSDQLQTTSFDVSLGAYYSQWPELGLIERRKILFIIQRSQRPMTLQYFGNFTLSVEVFVNICTTAWGYFNILRRVINSN